jgi:hypothetical protein
MGGIIWCGSGVPGAPAFGVLGRDGVPGAIVSGVLGREEQVTPETSRIEESTATQPESEKPLREREGGAMLRAMQGIIALRDVARKAPVGRPSWLPCHGY